MINNLKNKDNNQENLINKTRNLTEAYIEALRKILESTGVKLF